MSIFSWKMSPEDLRNEVQNYSTLKITQSYRGVSAILILGSMILTAILAAFRVVSSDAIYGAVIYLPLAFFIYRGHRWAMIVIMVLWTLEKGYQLYSSSTTAPIIPVIWWFIFMDYFVNAFRIELARRKIEPASDVPSPKQ